MFYTITATFGTSVELVSELEEITFSTGKQKLIGAEVPTLRGLLYI